MSGPLPLPELAELEALLERIEPHARIQVLSRVAVREHALPIYAIMLGTREPAAPALAFVGGVHGLERIGTQVVLAYLRTLSVRLAWDRVLADTLARVRLVFMPLVNPGGMLLRLRSNPSGVDLMRNAPRGEGGRGTFLVGGQRLWRRLPWYAGDATQCEPENLALFGVIERELLCSQVALAIDCHSGFGMIDRLWFPYARTRKPFPNLAEVVGLKRLLDTTLPHHIYRVEPQANAYTIEGDAWDYLYDVQRARAGARVRAAHARDGFVGLGAQESASDVVARRWLQPGGAPSREAHLAPPSAAVRSLAARDRQPRSLGRARPGAAKRARERGIFDLAAHVTGQFAQLSRKFAFVSPMRVLVKAKTVGRQNSMTLHTATLHQETSPLLVPHGLPFPHQRYPAHERGVPPGVHRSGRYALRFAHSVDDLRAAQRLRFEVFNLELREGLTASYETGLDTDDFDLHCHHLLVIDEKADEVVGTYRLMTHELAPRERLYTASEFDLSTIPEYVLRHGAEVGRACVAKEHRNGRVLQLLWRGIARYLDWNDKRFVFGCCSVPTLDPSEVASVSRKLAREGHLHARMHASVRPALRTDAADAVVAKEDAALPPLFVSYLRLGAKVCGGPASDREFCVTDYLVVLDLRDVEPRVLASLAAPGLWQTPS